jgi:hypothetical protein
LYIQDLNEESLQRADLGRVKSPATRTEGRRKQEREDNPQTKKKKKKKKSR